MTETRKDILWRVYLIYFSVMAFAVAIVIKLSLIQFRDGDKLREIAESQEILQLTLEASRGNILAADGSLLATSVPVFEVRMDVASPYVTDELFYAKIDSIAGGLSQILGRQSQAYYKNYIIKARKKGNRYLLLGKRVSYDELKQIKELPIFRRGKYQGGLITIQTTRRELPFHNLAERTIGYEIKSENLHVGLEGAYGETLKGTNGKQIVRRINNGDIIPIHDDNAIDPRDGLDIITTLDVNIQDIAENALLRQLMNHKAFWGCAVIMEVKTGYVRAIANLQYDSSDGKYKELYNHAIGASIEPGSTFKLPNIMAALEVGNIRLSDSVITNEGFAVVKNVPVQDVKKIGNGRVAVRDVVENSSNVGMAIVMNRAFEDDPAKYVDKLYDMSLNQPLGLAIQGEGKPKIKHPDDKDWWGTTLTVMSYGYELRLTPLQLLTFYNAVANNGKMVKPIFVTEIRDGVSVRKTFGPEVINPQIASAETIRQAKSLLEGVVIRGTGKNVFSGSPYRIAGKTGTAKIASGGKYNKEYNASVVGYFPADNPKYSCIVVINKPTAGKYYGGSV
ncbi:MAG: penicillin-binding protein 2, partial [bacterium]